MARNILEDEQGYPWTASAGLGWTVLLCVGSSAILLVMLALYLAVWIFTKGRRWSLVGFGAFGSALLLAITVGHWHVLQNASEWIFTFAAFLFLLSTFVLRYEIKQHYRANEGWEIEIGPWFTLFLSVMYINHCLNPMTLEQRDTNVSLNLNS